MCTEDGHDSAPKTAQDCSPMPAGPNTDAVDFRKANEAIAKYCHDVQQNSVPSASYEAPLELLFKRYRDIYRNIQPTIKIRLPASTNSKLDVTQQSIMTYWASLELAARYDNAGNATSCTWHELALDYLLSEGNAGIPNVTYNYHTY